MIYKNKNQKFKTETLSLKKKYNQVIMKILKIFNKNIKITKNIWNRSNS